MDTRLVATLARLRGVHGGDPWHGPSTLALLQQVSARDAAARPVEGAHSIWEIVRHMTAWALEATRRVQGGSPAEPEVGDWPRIEDHSDRAWAGAVEALTAANEALADAASRLSAEDLARRVGAERVPALGSGVTLHDTLEGVVAHHAYHAGQIALLLRATGARR